MRMIVVVTALSISSFCGLKSDIKPSLNPRLVAVEEVARAYTKLASTFTLNTDINDKVYSPFRVDSSFVFSALAQAAHHLADAVGGETAEQQKKGLINVFSVAFGVAAQIIKENEAPQPQQQPSESTKSLSAESFSPLALEFSKNGALSQGFVRLVYLYALDELNVLRELCVKECGNSQQHMDQFIEHVTEIAQAVHAYMSAFELIDESGASQHAEGLTFMDQLTHDADVSKTKITQWLADQTIAPDFLLELFVSLENILTHCLSTLIQTGDGSFTNLSSGVK